jgi:hypothetical protein
MQTTRRSTGKHGISAFTATTAASLLRWLAIIASAFAALIATPAQAEQWSLLLNGKAWHLEKPAGTHYNEQNWGAGVQYDFKMTENKWIPFVTVSGFKDSNKNPSYYAGGGALRRFSFGEEKNSFHLDAGVVAFFMTRKDYSDGKPFPGVLPVVAIGTDRVALNITYIPKVDPKMVPILFFQLKIGLN